MVCGLPDGRLAALTTAEASACLAVNQASSIQSIGGTCESITIGHNPFQLPLANRAIFLDKSRPDFLCEKILKDQDQTAKEKRASVCKIVKTEEPPKQSLRQSLTRRFSNSSGTTGTTGNTDEGLDRSRSSARLLGKKVTSLFIYVFIRILTMFQRPFTSLSIKEHILIWRKKHRRYPCMGILIKRLTRISIRLHM